jgi:hypothetical protein
MTSPDFTIPTLTAWRASLEGVTPGPWDVDAGTDLRPPVIVSREIDADDRGRAIYYKTEIATVADTADDEANAAHIAKCDPQTIAALLDLCIGMAEALRPFAEYATTIEGNYTMPLPDNLCPAPAFPMADFRRARTALQSIGRP